MPTRLIKFSDGTLIEVEANPNEPQQIAATQAQWVQETLDQVKPILVNVCKPLVAAWNELSHTMDIEQAEVELGLGFEGETGIPYIVKGTASATLTIKLTLKPRHSA